jgi:hypothetical protein
VDTVTWRDRYEPLLIDTTGIGKHPPEIDNWRPVIDQVRERSSEPVILGFFQ